MITDQRDRPVTAIGPLPLYQGWAPTTCGRWVFFYWAYELRTPRDRRPWERRAPSRRAPRVWRVKLGQVADTLEEALEHDRACGGPGLVSRPLPAGRSQSEAARETIERATGPRER